MLGEYLYGLTPKDAAASPVVQRALLVKSAAGAATEVDADFAAQNTDTVFLCRSLVIRATPGAGQTVRTWIWQLRDAGGATIADLAAANNNPAIAAAINVGQSFEGTWLIMPGEQLRAAVLFSAGGVSNAVLAYATGFYLPRGNIQL